MMRYIKTINLSVYNCKFVYILTEDPAIEVKKIQKKHSDVGDLEGSCEGVMVAPDSDITIYYLIIDLKYLTHNTIGHESYHLVEAVSKHRGMNNNEESCAWIAGFINGTFMKFVYDKKLKVEPGI